MSEFSVPKKYSKKCWALTIGLFLLTLVALIVYAFHSMFWPHSPIARSTLLYGYHKGQFSNLVVEHFPASIPDGATDVEKWFTPGPLQANATLCLRVRLDESSFVKERERLESIFPVWFDATSWAHIPDDPDDELLSTPEGWDGVYERRSIARSVFWAFEFGGIEEQNLEMAWNWWEEHPNGALAHVEHKLETYSSVAIDPDTRTIWYAAEER